MPAEAAAGGRYFFALWPPAAVACGLHTMAASLAGCCGGRVQRAEALHLTLAFVGAVPEARFPELLALAAGLRRPAVAVRLDRLGFWAHNRLLWAGVGEAAAAPVVPLAVELRTALRQAGFLAEDAAAFVPHVTLVRQLRAPEVLPELPAAAWPAAEFVLARSRPGAAGSIYETVARWPLS